MISRDKAPLKKPLDADGTAAGLRGRLLVTVGILILARLGVFCPYRINREQFAQAIQNNNP